jgi:hypothetical protein
MSATPRPLTDEDLYRFEVLDNHRLAPPFPTLSDSAQARILWESAKNVPALLAEVRRLRSGQDAHVCGEPFTEVVREREEFRAKLREAQGLLLERARQAEELMRERDEARAALREAAAEARVLREVLYPAQKIPVALAAVDRYNALIARLASMDGLTEIEKARRAVVEAVRELFVEARKGDMAPLEHNLDRYGILAVDSALAALERVEDPEWIVERACPEHKAHDKVRFRWGPPPHQPCPNCFMRPVSKAEGPR